MNGMIVIDKPAGWTSHDVVGKLRSVLREKRIGHSGTLDPMATGVLPVFIGRATRAIAFCESDDKEYLAGLRLGIVTDTQDTTGTTVSECGTVATEDELKSVIPLFTGKLQQIPPMYSAVKIKGQKLYQLARKGIEVERSPRSITVFSLDVVERSGGDYILDVVCSKGTYVRTLCHDIGQKLGCGAAMSSLRRVRAGRFTIDDAVTIEDVQKAAESGTASGLLKPIDSIFDGYPAYTASPEETMKCLNGSSFPVRLADGTYRVYGDNGGFLMLGRVSDNEMTTIKSFFEV